MAPENQTPEQPQNNPASEMPVVSTMPEQPIAPVETPVEPVQVEPVQSTPLVVTAPFGAPQPTMPIPAAKKSKKGLIIGLSIAGGVILAAVIAVVLWHHPERQSSFSW